MYLENVNIENCEVDFLYLDDIMKNLNFSIGDHWDYERVVYDYKFKNNYGIFYLRIPGVAKEGNIGDKEAVICLKKPYIGKYYFNHGLEYSDDEFFPKQVVNSSKDLLKRFEKLL
jgi:hypothetical protein